MPGTRSSTRLAEAGKDMSAKAAAAPKKESNKRKVEPSDGEQKADGKKAKKAANEAPAGLKIGDKLPTDLTLKNEKGKDVEIGKLTEEQGVVLFLVPKANTPGCTNQACSFRDNYPSFQDSGFDVYCLSADPSSAQEKWQNKQSLPYPLLSDPKRDLISALGAGAGGKTTRSHFVFGKGGELLDKAVPVKAAESAKLALKFIESLKT